MLSLNMKASLMQNKPNLMIRPSYIEGPISKVCSLESYFQYIPMSRLSHGISWITIIYMIYVEARM